MDKEQLKRLVNNKERVGDESYNICREVSKFGIEDASEKYVKLKYKLDDDESYFNPIIRVTSSEIKLGISSGTVIERIPEGVYNYIVFLNDRDEFIMILCLFNPQEIGSKHASMYNRLPDNSDYRNYILSGELDLKYDSSGEYFIVFNDSSSFYWFCKINFKKDVFLRVLKDIVNKLEDPHIDISLKKKVELKDDWKDNEHRGWEKYIIEKLKIYGYGNIVPLNYPFSAFYRYSNFKKTLFDTDIANRRIAYERISTAQNIKFESESIYTDEINKLMNTIFSELNVKGSIKFVEKIEKTITNDMFFTDFCEKNSGSDFLKRFKIYNNYDDCEKENDENSSEHLCDYF